MSRRTDFVASELDRLGDPVRARQMAAYMKTDMPFYGVTKPDRVVVFAEMQRRFAVASRQDYRDAVAELWGQPHREEKYLAIALARAHPEYQTVSSVGLYRRLIVEGGWWDLVDEVAVQLVGAVWLRDRERTTPVMRRWIDDAHLWLRRSAVIGQLRHKAATDEALLFEFCLSRAHETEFFIRKAIGWALREYAKTSPESVRAFVDAHQKAWSGLTYREATKHL